MTAISDGRLKELVEAAKKATPGEWGEGDKWVFAPPRDGKLSSALEHIFRNEEAQANAGFIALANPSTVAAMAEELLKLRAAAIKVYAGLNARIDAAPADAVPAFDGIAELHDALSSITQEQS